MYHLNNSGETRTELAEGRWFRQAQPTLPRFFEMILNIAIKQFEASTRTAQDAANAIGCDVAQIVKSLLFVVNGQPTIALVSGVNQLDEKKTGDLVRRRQKKG